MSTKMIIPQRLEHGDLGGIEYLQEAPERRDKSPGNPVVRQGRGGEEGEISRICQRKHDSQRRRGDRKALVLSLLHLGFFVFYLYQQ